MLDLINTLDTSFGKLTNTEVIVRFAAIGDLMVVHPAYQDTFPEAVPDATRIKALVTGFKERVDAAGMGARDRIAERNDAREDLILSVTLMARYIEILASYRGDPSMLEHTGFRIKSRSYSRGLGVPVVNPEIFSLKNGSETGSVIITTKRHPGRAAYIIEICKGDPANGGTWSYFGHFLQCKNLLRGLEPATQVYFRTRYDINGNLSDWSISASIIVT